MSEEIKKIRLTLRRRGAAPSVLLGGNSNGSAADRLEGHQVSAVVVTVTAFDPRDLCGFGLGLASCVSELC